MTFSPYQLDEGRELICSIADKIRKRRCRSAVVRVDSGNNFINICRTQGIYLGGGRNSSFISVADSSSLSEMSNSKQGGGSVRGLLLKPAVVGHQQAVMDDREMFQLRGKDLQVWHRAFGGKTPSSQPAIRDSAETVTQPDKALAG